MTKKEVPTETIKRTKNRFRRRQQRGSDDLQKRTTAEVLMRKREDEKRVRTKTKKRN